MALNVTCETVDLETQQIEGVRIIDHTIAEHRQWLGRHAYWAMRNGKMLRTYAQTSTALQGDDDE